ncbi:MAG: hypothetical protein IKA64_01625 [Clostridia bacterium]|nr:hypothetical protein [Clostridia bacterium]
MHDNRNALGGLSGDCRSTVCISTNRVLDSCRDRDCFEDARVYLTAYGEEVIASATSVRTKYARTLWAYVGLEEVPFNCGFYQIAVRYYIEVTVEACMGIGRSQTVKGLVVLEKDVILYGGEGGVTSFSSGPYNTFCNMGDPGSVTTSDPVAVVETVEPVLLGTRVAQDCCTCGCGCDGLEVPNEVLQGFDGELVSSTGGCKLLVSLGIFSVIRIERPAQLLVSATDYSVPDKECDANCGNESPCDLFRSIAFPSARFKGNTCCESATDTASERGGGCGCGKR